VNKALLDATGGALKPSVKPSAARDYLAAAL